MSVIQGDVGGGGGTDATITFSDITTNDVSASKHGFMPKLPNTATKFWRDDGTYQTIAGGGDALIANPLSQFAATTSLQLKGVISDETGSGALAFATSPTLVTPVLGVATATTVNKVALTAPATGSTLTIADGKTLTVSNDATVSGTNTGDVANTALTTGSLAQFASTTSAEMRTLLSDETGTGFAVFATSPTLVTPVLGVAAATSINKVAITAPAASATLTIADGVTLTVPAAASVQGTHSGTSSGTNTGDVANTALTTGTLAQFAATTSAQLATLLTDETGSGAAVFATSPALVTPTLGVAAVTTVNKVTVTAPATGSTLTIQDGFTLTVSANATVSGTHTGTSSGTNTGDQTNITGNAATVTTNANLTGPVTSVGNATTIADAELAAIAGLTSAADRLPYFTGSGTASLATFTSAARALLDDADAATMLATLGALALAGGTMAGAIAMGNNNITGVKQVTFNGVVAGGNKTGASPSLADWTTGSWQAITLTGNVTGTPTFTAPSGPSRLTLKVTAGAFTMVWPTAVKWAGGAAPTLSTSNYDIVTLLYDGTNYDAVASLGFA